MNNNQFFITVYLIASGNQLQVVQYSDPPNRDAQLTIPRGIDLSLAETEDCLRDGLVHVDLRGSPPVPSSLVAFARQLGCEAAAYIPILEEGQLRGVVVIGTRSAAELTDDVVNSFARTIRLTAQALQSDRPVSEPLDERRTRELNAINMLAIHAANTNDLQSFYSLIHEQVRAVIGDHGFVIALYDRKTNSIHIPYLYEEGAFSSIESFPLGEGLTSILIRTGEPLLLVEDTEKRAAAMGARIAGKPALSWLGVPLMARGEAIGALIVQDLQQEHAFDNLDQRFLTSVASQVSGDIHNVRLLSESQQVALQFETAAEIARDISSSLNLDELLQKAVDLIRTRFNFYHASVFLKDLAGEYVVIREATGEAG
ncbi:MAG TPA: GAF domain-containing protein, partial [Anaerolineales bacterium]|nr:GAF domain-containing protein [Anaerolineales bacterium]